MVIELPFPPAILSGHANGNGRWAKIKATKDWRALAKAVTLAAMPDLVKECPRGRNPGGATGRASGAYSLTNLYGLEPCDVNTSDMPIAFHFHPPDNRSDRLNYPNRIKPIADGIADALGVNDRRFLPSYHFHPVSKPGRVVVVIG
jgi:hypothetical protein